VSIDEQVADARNFGGGLTAISLRFAYVRAMEEKPGVSVTYLNQLDELSLHILRKVFLKEELDGLRLPALEDLLEDTCDTLRRGEATFL
jgi:hypothetical protein